MRTVFHSDGTTLVDDEGVIVETIDPGMGRLVVGGDMPWTSSLYFESLKICLDMRKMRENIAKEE